MRTPRRRTTSTGLPGAGDRRDVNATLTDAEGASTAGSARELAARLPERGFFWLDLANASEDEYAAVAAALHLDDSLSSWLPRFGRSAHLESSPRYLRISAWADAGVPQPLVAGYAFGEPGMDAVSAKHPKVIA